MSQPSAQNGHVRGHQPVTSEPEDFPTEDLTPDEIPDQLQDDVLVQYLRCRYSQRKDLLGSNPDAKVRVKSEKKRIKKLRKTYEETEENEPVVHDFKRLRAAWKVHAKDKSGDELKNVSKRVSEMRSLKKKPEERKRRIQLERKILSQVQRWDTEQYDPSTPIQANHAPSDSELGSPGCFSGLSRVFGKDTKKGKDKNKKKPFDDDSEEQPKPNRPRPPDSYGITVSKITLKKTPLSSSYMSYEIERYPLNDVLYNKKDNPLKRMADTEDPNTIRYFHFPSNNMHWIEEAIGRYYDEDTPGEYNWRKHPNYRHKSSSILCREYWSSLQHGGKFDPIHARHMRAHCSLIIPEVQAKPEPGIGNRNFVIFMPYLHWESHKRRKQMATVTREITKQHIKDSPRGHEILRDEVTRAVQEVHLLRSMTDFHQLKETKASDNDEKEKKRCPLGKYLLQIAKIYDAMDIEPDVRMLRDHLHQDPPLHSRRTLDQSYYWKLQNTDNRDEDQVVYRATMEGKSPLRTTRVVMVDQLWLYILDENTIISSFPRRWGRNKPDYSGVHKGIRAILNNPRVGQIESVYDLALLIINQASTVFFDRTKPVDERPELLDIFSNALSHISGMKTVAFEAFWRHLDKLSESDRKAMDLESTARKYLNINPEGKLLKEVHDIIEELRMMMRIFAQQKTVADDFAEHLRTLHDQERKHNLNMPADDGKLEIMVQMLNLMQDRNQILSHGTTTPVLGKGGQQSPPNEPVNTPKPIQTPTSTVTENTLRHAKRVVDNIVLRRTELEELEGSTNSIYEQLKDLLSLKQQQASIIEAKYALKRADESVKQGRSVMLFTIVTIIFLPLSFMSSVFGMNASDFDAPGPDGGNRMSLRDQFKLLFPISIGVIIISISLAFSTWIRGVIYYTITVSWAYFIEYTSIRRLMVKLSTKLVGKHDSNQIYIKQVNKVREIHAREDKKKMREAMKEAGLTNEDEKKGDGGLKSRLFGVKRAETAEGQENRGRGDREREGDEESGCFSVFYDKD